METSSVRASPTLKIQRELSGAQRRDRVRGVDRRERQNQGQAVRGRRLPLREQGLRASGVFFPKRTQRCVRVPRGGLWKATKVTPPGPPQYPRPAEVLPERQRAHRLPVARRMPSRHSALDHAVSNLERDAECFFSSSAARTREERERERGVSCARFSDTLQHASKSDSNRPREILK